MGIFSGIVKATLAVAAIAVLGPVVIPAMLSGDMDGIDGYYDDD